MPLSEDLECLWLWINKAEDSDLSQGSEDQVSDNSQTQDLDNSQTQDSDNNQIQVSDNKQIQDSDNKQIQPSEDLVETTSQTQLLMTAKALTRINLTESYLALTTTDVESPITKWLTSWES